MPAALLGLVIIFLIIFYSDIFIIWRGVHKDNSH
jgi:hypothetical protein